MWPRSCGHHGSPGSVCHQSQSQATPQAVVHAEPSSLPFPPALRCVKSSWSCVRKIIFRSSLLIFFLFVNFPILSSPTAHFVIGESRKIPTLRKTHLSFHLSVLSGSFIMISSLQEKIHRVLRRLDNPGAARPHMDGSLFYLHVLLIESAVLLRQVTQCSIPLCLGRSVILKILFSHLFITSSDVSRGPNAPHVFTRKRTLLALKIRWSLHKLPIPFL